MSVSTWGRYNIYRLLKSCKGSQTFRYLRMFEEHQFMPFEQLAELRMRCLENLLYEAFYHVPGYAQRLADVCDAPWDWDRFFGIPPLVRENLALDNPRFIHSQALKGPVVYTQTGGSTGTPVEILHSRDFRDWLQASTFFYNTWGGLTLGKPYFMLWAAYRDIQPQLQNWRERLLLGVLQNRKILNCRVTSPELMPEFAHRIREDRHTRHMMAYANEMHALASYCREAQVEMTGTLDAIYVTANTLTDTMRDDIEDVFGCRVYNRYGCRDAGEIAFSCPYQRGLHINPLYALVEIADEAGTPLSYGQEGQVLLTILHNRAMPLIRYAVGDMAILRPAERCECGREWETLERVTGYLSESLYLPNGTRLGGGLLYMILEHLPALQRFQIHQVEQSRLFIKLRSPVPDYVGKYRTELLHVGERLHKLTGNRFTIDFEQTETFDRTPTGKELFVVHRPQRELVPG